MGSEKMSITSKKRHLDHRRMHHGALVWYGMDGWMSGCFGPYAIFPGQLRTCTYAVAVCHTLTCIQFCNKDEILRCSRRSSSLTAPFLLLLHRYAAALAYCFLSFVLNSRVHRRWSSVSSLTTLSDASMA